MQIVDYDIVAQSLLDEAKRIETSKRPGYTIGDADVLANFKRVADRVRVQCPCGCGHVFPIPAGAALCVYLLKHADAIVAILSQPTLPVSEAPLGRFADLVNYAKLGFALHSEEAHD